MTFDAFDPLEFKSNKASEAALQALKREIKNILSSYVGWFDPFSELIQNALDSVELRASEEVLAGNAGYKPCVRVTINIRDNELSVTDNGVGLDKDQFQQFLAPNFSFKSGDTRGHKGVGATYIAYGFNSMRIETKALGFSATGQITNARKWLTDPSPSANPRVEPVNGAISLADFVDVDRGVSVSVKFDETTHPKKLSWVQARTALAWWKILSIKTGLGAIRSFTELKLILRVIDDGGSEELREFNGASYYWVKNDSAKVARIRDILDIEKVLFGKYGAGFKHPDKISNLDVVFDSWTADELRSLVQMDEEELQVWEAHKPTIGLSLDSCG